MKFIDCLKRKTLKKTFEEKLQYKRSLGTDGVSTNKFSDIIDSEISIIKRKVKNLTYNISPYKEQLIIKNRSSNPRMISIPTNRDKLLLSILQDFLAQQFKDNANNDDIAVKIHRIKQLLQSKQYDTFIKLDIKNFYPNIDHKILLQKVREYTNDEEALFVLEKALTQVTISKGRRVNKENNILTKGVAQGLSISNILASIYLNDIDSKYSMQENLSYFRYVDDILILCNKSNLESIRLAISKDIEALQLELHEFTQDSNKSIRGVINQDKFQFLGFEFVNHTVSAREQSVDKLKDRIVQVFYSNSDKKLKDLYRELNLKITGCIYDNKEYGWMQFFRQIDDLTLLFSLDMFVKNLFKRFNRKYKENKIKRFTKTYYFLKNYDVSKLDKETYIPKYGTTISKDLQISIQSLFDDIEFY